jgi:putative peptide zinc metalloprotease protein
LRVSDIDRDTTRTLTEPQLAMGHGGTIAVRERRGLLVPDQAVYRVSLRASVDSDAMQLPHLRGRVVIDGTPTSLLVDGARSAAAVLMREAGW